MKAIRFKSPFNTKRKQWVDYSDNDSASFYRKISGRITKERYKLFKRWERTVSWRAEPCGHVHDCCGCLVRQYGYVEIEGNEVTLYVSRVYNY